MISGFAISAAPLAALSALTAPEVGADVGDYIFQDRLQRTLIQTLMAPFSA